ncbi:MAG: hypothetical protein Q9M91_07320 [Candidatus Dojkabacteria bacterium]|nr:hypothetical protein [Candidatus Dojkabacteria bacterium]
MNFKYLKLTFVFVSIVIFTLLALPEFNIKVNGTEIDYKAVDFGTVGIDAKFSSFEKSSDLFPSTRIRVEANFDTEMSQEEKENALEKMMQVYIDRIDYKARFDDIKIQTLSSEEFNGFVFVVPERYEFPEETVEWITGKGEINFTGSILNASLDDSEITNSYFDDEIGVEVSQNAYDYARFPTLVYEFKDKEDDIATIANGGYAGIDLTVDGRDFEFVAHETKDNAIRIQAIFDGEESQITNELYIDYLKIVESYLEDDVLEYSVNIINVSSEAPLYNPEGASFIGITFILGLVVVAFAILIKRVVVPL